MKHKLTLHIYLDEKHVEDLKHILRDIFATELIEINLPINTELDAILKKQSGFSITFIFAIAADPFDKSVNNLLKSLQIFSTDWERTGPLILLNNKHTFIASHLPEMGSFNQSYINKMAAHLQESGWE